MCPPPKPPPKPPGDSSQKILEQLQDNKKTLDDISQSTQKLNVIDGKIKAQSGQLEEITTTLKAISEGTQKLDKIDEKVGKLESIDSKLSEQKISLGNVETALGEQGVIAVKLAEQRTTLAGIETKADRNRSELSSQIDRHATEHASRLTSIEESIGAKLDTHYTSLKDIDTSLGRLKGIEDTLGGAKRRLVTGHVAREDALPLQDVHVRAVHEVKQGGIRLGDDSTDADGRYTIYYALPADVGAVNLRVVAYGEGGRPLASSEVVRDAKPVETIDLTIPIAARPAAQPRIEGRVLLEHGLAAGGVELRLYKRKFGGETALLCKTTTLTGGEYAFSYESDGKPVSVEVRAVDANGKEVALSGRIDDMPTESPLLVNLLAPLDLKSTDSEYGRLSADLVPLVGNMSKLKDAREDTEQQGQQQDLADLSRGSGWDARLIALASIAERLATDPDVGLTSEELYGLLRAGLPFDKLLLARVEPDVVEMAIKKVRDARVVQITDDGIANLKTKFTNFTVKTRLAMPAPGSRSTYRDLLESSGLPPEAQNEFANVLLKHGGDAAQLWQKAGDPELNPNLNPKLIARLQLHGKLAFLAGNSHSITTRLLDEKGLKDPSELASQGFHDAAEWKKEVLRNVPDTDIPATYTGENTEARLDAYAEDMARKVRVSYPTQVLGRLMETDQRFELSSGHDVTVTLLKNATAQGFRLGETPVSTFLQSRPGLGQTLSKAELNTATEQLKTLQRVYQITPCNEAMPVLLQMKIASALDVMAYPEARFSAIFNAKYQNHWKKPAPANLPVLIRRKARQVSSITYNLFAIAKKVDIEPTVMAISGSTAQHADAKNALKRALKAYPTMESLFGSMDYCECDHCRSVLSPAAYLVDLLQFVDTDPGIWEHFLGEWKEMHGNQEYPHKNVAGEAIRPYDVLVGRRPDLAHLALTCENTNTALPYIDVVNELLEYYVAHKKLAKEAARDTGDATTAELLAEPQHVIAEAYDALRSARYPLNLPFDLWLETVRKFCDYFETPLHRVLDVIRPDEDLCTSIQNPTNAGDATASIANVDAVKLANGMTCTYLSSTTSASGGEWKRISGIGTPDSGGPGQTTITFEGTWASPPSAKDRLVFRPLDHRAAIFMESLGLSPAEVEIFTDPNPLPRWHELYGFKTEADATTELTDDTTGQRVDLNSAKALSRRLGVTYKEITEIVQTAFVNPELGKLSLLYTLGVSVRDARLYADEHNFYEGNRQFYVKNAGKKREDLTPPDQETYDALTQTRGGRDITGWDVLHEVEAFEQRLANLEVAFDPQLNAADMRAAIQNIPFDRAVVLADPDAGCSFDQTTLQYADGKKADAMVFLRINLFVRLWRKLGWSIEETDRALTSFIPQNAPFDGTAGNLAKQPFKTALICLAHLKELDGKLKVGKQSRTKLLTICSDIATTGTKPLYAQLFLNRSVLKSSPAFDHPLGEYLTDVNVKLKDHLLTLQGALGLTADEISRILSDADKSLDAAELSLSNVSILYRYRLLAEALKLSVRELITLKRLSGLDPFKALHPEPLATLDQDHLFAQTLEFVRVADEVKDSGLKIEDLEFLLQHRLDETGKYRPDRDGALAFLKSLSQGVQAICAEHALPDDPEALSEEVLRQKLGLALAPDVVERFLGMVNTRAEFTAIKSGANALEFFGSHLKKQTLGISGEAGFLEDADFASLFAPLSPLKPISSTESPAEVAAKQKENQQIEEKNQKELQRRRYRIGQAFLPFLRDRLIRQFIVQTMTAQTGADPVLVESLICDDRLLAAPKALWAIFAATAAQGLDATFWPSAAATGTHEPAVLLPDADTSVKDSAGKPLRPAGARSARLDAYLEVPASGSYRFYIELDKDAEAELRFPDRPDPVLVKGVAGPDGATLGDQPDEYLELKAGVLYRLSLELKHLNGGDARLLVHGETVPKGPLSQLALYPAGAIDAAERASTLLTKALQLVQSLGVSQREIRYLLTHASDFDGLSFSELPTVTIADSPAERAAAAQRFKRFRRLAAYSRVKRDLAGGTDDLIAVFEANGTTAANRLEEQVYPLLAKLTRREGPTIKATAEALVKERDVPRFESERSLWRLWEALQVVERFGVPPASLLRWTGIVTSETEGKRRFEIARDSRDAIKARFERDTWQRVAQPIFDKLRPRQRDALVSHILQQMSENDETKYIDTREKLYEYFLVDPGMEPVVQTSRIRLAIASLQLFIQRCLLNMEPDVHPSAIINAEQWEWMKRYRVWEANRKIFLFPENWLEPEFRDDKTHLFTELEGALLQGDVSSDLVEDAFLNYLRKLDELARLDICAMHIEDDADPALRVLHVIGRTYSQPRKYFYRRYAQQMWTPWEPVSAEIEGDHLAPVVWRDRLYLFWVTFLEKPQGNQVSEIDPTQTVPVPPVMKDVEAQLHWSEYAAGQWLARESGDFSAPSPVVAKGLMEFDPKSVFIHVTKEYQEGEERGVYVHLHQTASGWLARAQMQIQAGASVGARPQAGPAGPWYFGNAAAWPFRGTFYLPGRNSSPEAGEYAAPPQNPFTSANTPIVNRYQGTGVLTVNFKERSATELGKTPPPANVLNSEERYDLLPCNNLLTALGEGGVADIPILIKPVFYQNSRHTFFVEAEVTERTIEEWQGWVPWTPVTEPSWKNPDWWNDLVVTPVIPRKWPEPTPKDPWRGPIHPGSIKQPITDPDWLVNSGSVIKFDDVLIGPTGRPGLEIRSNADRATNVGHVNVAPGSDVAHGSSIVLTDTEPFVQAGLRETAGGFNVVGGAGFSSALRRNISDP
jgi:hypothetical protein